MTLMQILGFFCSVLIGLSLGLIGGGGSMLTIPVLVYLLGINPMLSTAYSLFVVGTTSLVGSVNYIRRQQVHYPAALLFALPSFGAIFLTRRYIISAIPNLIRVTESFRLSKDVALMLLFAFITLAASLLMITGTKTRNYTDPALSQYDYPLMVLTGLLVGTLTGLVGIGGGFLIVPALVLLVQLSMKRAVGTSLLIIAANSFTGFLSNPIMEHINWPFLLAFTALAVLGILVGAYMSRFISGLKLRKVFGWSVLLVSLLIIAKETLMPTVSHNSVVHPYIESKQKTHPVRPGEFFVWKRIVAISLPK